MRFGEILDTTFSLYRKHFLFFLGIIVLYFCGILVEYLFERFLPEFSGKNFVVDLIDMPFTLISMGGIIVATATIAVQRIIEITVGFILTLTKLVGAASSMDIIKWLVIYTPIDVAPLFLTIMMWVGFVVKALIFPIWVICITLLYFDLRIRKEGFNGEMPVF